jgi:hypothetical protein
MESTLFEGIIKRLSETSEAGLSFNEIEALKFLREETRKQAEIYKAFTDGINSKNGTWHYLTLFYLPKGLTWFYSIYYNPLTYLYWSEVKYQT